MLLQIGQRCPVSAPQFSCGYYSGCFVHRGIMKVVMFLAECFFGLCSFQHYVCSKSGTI